MPGLASAAGLLRLGLLTGLVPVLAVLLRCRFRRALGGRGAAGAVGGATADDADEMLDEFAGLVLGPAERDLRLRYAGQRAVRQVLAMVQPCQRLRDHDQTGAMEKKKQDGYF